VASIKNIIETTFSTKGAAAAAAATETVTKQQTRLGQTSASAGRQFSAQASGLGGLVSVYAGAAANIFAITSAFQALSRAARNEEVIRGTQTLARTIGESGDQIIAKTKEITKNQLSIVEAATQVNTALSAGFSAKQIEGLTTVSLKASRALGRDLTDSFNRLVRGSAKLEPELIDELGIFTRIEPAVNKYAASLNRSASSLTTFERRQAFVNAVIDEGNAKFGIIDTSSKTSQQSIEQLAAKFQDLTQSVLGFVANVLSPIADFLSKTGNLIIAFGAVGAIVFSKLKDSIVAGLGSGFDFVTRKLDNLTEKFSRAGPEALTKFQAAAKQALSKGEGGLTGTGAIQGTNAKLARTEGAEIRKLLATQDLSIRQAERGKELTARRIADLKALDNGTGVYAAQIKGLETAETAFNDRLEGTGKIARGTAKGVSGLAGTFRVLQGAVVAVGAAMSKILIYVGIAQGVLSLFGIDLIGEVIGYFERLNAQARQNRKEIEGLSTAILNSSGTAVQYAKALGLTEDQIADVRKEQADLIQGVQAGSVNAQIASEKTDRLTKYFLLFGKSQIQYAASQDLTGKSLERTTKLLNDNDAGVKTLDARIKALTDKTGDLTKEEKFRLLVLQETKQAIKTVGKENVGLLRGIVATGVSYDSAAKAVKQLTDENGAAVKEYKNLLDVIIQNVGGQNEFIAGAEAQGAALVATTGAIQNFNEQLKLGVNSEKLSQALVRANRELEKFSDTLDFDDLSNQQEEALYKLEKRIQSLSNTLANVQGLEKINKDLQSTFGGALKAVDSLLASGSISKVGKIAEIAATPEEVKANQMKFLDDTIAAAGNISDKQREAVRLQEMLVQAQKEGKNNEASILQGKIKSLGITSIEIQRATNATTAEKAKAGLIIEAAKDSTKLLRTQQRSLAVLQQQLAVLKAQASVDILQKELDLLKARQANAREIQQAKNEANAAERAAAATVRKGLEQEVDLRIKALEASKQLAQAEAARAEAAQRATNAAARRADLQKVNAAERQQNQLGLLGNLATEKQIRDAEINVAREKFNAEMARLDREENLIRTKLAADLAALDKQAAILREQIELNEVKKTNAALEALDQFKALDEKKALDDKARSDRAEQIVKEKELVLSQQKVADLQAANAAKDREYQLGLIEKKVKLLEMQAQVDDRYITAMAKILEQQARLVELQTGKKDPQLEEVKKTARELANSTIKTLQTNVENLRTNIEAQKTASADILNEEIKKNQRLADLKTSLLNAEEQKIKKIQADVDRRYAAESAKILENYNQKIKEIEAQSANTEAQLKSIEAQKAAASSNAQEKLTALNIERDKQKEIIALAERKYQLEEAGLLKYLQAAAGIIEGALNKGVDDLFEAIKNGTLTMKNFKEGLMNMLKGILVDLAKQAFKQFIVQPVTDFLKQQFQGLLGGLTKTATTALTQTLPDAASSAIKSSLGNIEGSVKALKDVGIQSVYVTNVSEFCACSGGGVGEAAGGLKIPGTGGPKITDTGGSGKSPVPGEMLEETKGAFSDLWDSIKSGVSGIVDSVSGAFKNLGDMVSDWFGGGSGGITSNGVPVEVLKSKNVPIGTLLGDQVQSDYNLGGGFNPMGTGYSSTTYGPFDMFGQNTLNPSGPGGFGAMGFGAPGGLGNIGGSFTPLGGSVSPFGTSFGQAPMGGFPAATPFSTDKFTNRVSEAGIGDGGLGLEGVTAELDNFTTGLKDGVTNLGDFGTKVTDSSGLLSSFGTDTQTAGGSLLNVGNDASVLGGSLGSAGAATQALEAAQVGSKVAAVSQTTADTTLTTAAYSAATALQTVGASGSAGGGGGFFTALVAAASGGLVGRQGIARYAAGGNVRTRDSVPALLEPGEFVMKKSAVDAIGASNMERMNATGKTALNSAPKVKVQIENKGSDKEAEQGETQMDGETAIVKLILKDLDTNGPIRRSIRSNT